MTNKNKLPQINRGNVTVNITARTICKRDQPHEERLFNPNDMAFRRLSKEEVSIRLGSALDMTVADATQRLRRATENDSPGMPRREIRTLFPRWRTY